jgi:hypothetical protein
MQLLGNYQSAKYFAAGVKVTTNWSVLIPMKMSAAILSKLSKMYNQPKPQNKDPQGGNPTTHHSFRIIFGGS